MIKSLGLCVRVKPRELGGEGPHYVGEEVLVEHLPRVDDVHNLVTGVSHGFREGLFHRADAVTAIAVGPTVRSFGKDGAVRDETVGASFWIRACSARWRRSMLPCQRTAKCAPIRLNGDCAFTDDLSPVRPT